jgi:GLPGLI family protein
MLRIILPGILIFSLVQQCLSQAKTTNYDISYSGYFNTQYERGHQVIFLQGRLQGNERESVFFMRQLESGRDQEEPAGQSIVITQDTLFRVLKFLEIPAILFGEPGFDGREHFYRDSLHPQPWTLHMERKKIGELECLKATTRFRGRSYIAWYCPSIPVTNGPWKLGGLPGLIIEAYEQNRDLYFKLTEFRPEPDHVDFIIPAAFAQPAGYPAYPEYIEHWRSLKARMDALISARETGNCASCGSQTRTNMYFWEKILD